MEYRIKYEVFDGYGVNSKGVSESKAKILNNEFSADSDKTANAMAEVIIKALKHMNHFNKIVSFERIDQREKTTRLNLSEQVSGADNQQGSRRSGDPSETIR